jgi:hypothetical protein
LRIFALFNLYLKWTRKKGEVEDIAKRKTENKEARPANYFSLPSWNVAKSFCPLSVSVQTISFLSLFCFEALVPI